MCPPLCPEDETVYDLIGLGFGPANLAIAGALLEKWGASTVGRVTLPLDLTSCLL